MKGLTILAALAVLLTGMASAAAYDYPSYSYRHAKPHGFSEGNKTGWNSYHRPPGWSHGHKQGWNDKSFPPGLQTKRYW